MGLFGLNIQKLEEKGNIESLIKALQHRKTDIVIQALESLGRLKKVETIAAIAETIIRFAPDKDNKEESTCIYNTGLDTLSVFDNEKAAQLLSSQIFSLYKTSSSRLTKVLRALVRQKYQRAVDNIIKLIIHEKIPKKILLDYFVRLCPQEKELRMIYELGRKNGWNEDLMTFLLELYCLIDTETVRTILTEQIQKKTYFAEKAWEQLILWRDEEIISIALALIFSPNLEARKFLLAEIPNLNISLIATSDLTKLASCELLPENFRASIIEHLVKNGEKLTSIDLLFTLSNALRRKSIPLFQQCFSDINWQECIQGNDEDITHYASLKNEAFEKALEVSYKKENVFSGWLLFLLGREINIDQIASKIGEKSILHPKTHWIWKYISYFPDEPLRRLMNTLCLDTSCREDCQNKALKVIETIAPDDLEYIFRKRIEKAESWNVDRINTLFDLLSEEVQIELAWKLLKNVSIWRSFQGIIDHIISLITQDKTSTKTMSSIEKLAKLRTKDAAIALLAGCEGKAAWEEKYEIITYLRMCIARIEESDYLELQKRFLFFVDSISENDEEQLNTFKIQTKNYPIRELFKLVKYTTTDIGKAMKRYLLSPRNYTTFPAIDLFVKFYQEGDNKKKKELVGFMIDLSPRIRGLMAKDLDAGKKMYWSKVFRGLPEDFKKLHLLDDKDKDYIIEYLYAKEPSDEICQKLAYSIGKDALSYILTNWIEVKQNTSLLIDIGIDVIAAELAQFFHKDPDRYLPLVNNIAKLASQDQLYTLCKHLGVRSISKSKVDLLSGCKDEFLVFIATSQLHRSVAAIAIANIQDGRQLKKVFETLVPKDEKLAQVAVVSCKGDDYTLKDIANSKHPLSFRLKAIELIEEVAFLSAVNKEKSQEIRKAVEKQRKIIMEKQREKNVSEIPSASTERLEKLAHDRDKQVRKEAKKELKRRNNKH